MHAPDNTANCSSLINMVRQFADLSFVCPSSEKPLILNSGEGEFDTVAEVHTAKQAPGPSNRPGGALVAELEAELDQLGDDDDSPF